jgi:sulfate/thiosulfate transport system permease protein
VRAVLIGTAVLFLGLFLFVPLAAVFKQALEKGARAYVRAVTHPDTAAALRLTLLVAAIAVPLNAAFGLAASWAIAKFRFRGRGLLLALIDLPLAVSPVVSGLLCVLVFGRRGLLGGWLESHGLHVVFATPGIVLATLFVTFPYVAREVLPVMEALGNEEEEAARVLGASGWQTFFRVTLPNVKWGVLYGIVTESCS